MNALIAQACGMYIIFVSPKYLANKDRNLAMNVVLFANFAKMLTA